MHDPPADAFRTFCRNIAHQLCRRVRYSLSGSTVFLAGRYGKACRRVRYVLLGSTVKLVGGYGIALQASVRATIAAFAGLLSITAQGRVVRSQNEGRIC